MKEIEILKEINKNSKIGIDGINFILEKAIDNDFKNMLYSQKDEYQNIYDRSKNLLLQNNEYLENTQTLQKAMSWIGIQMSTLTNATDSKLAEILIQGNDMGIIKGTKLLNSLPFKTNGIRNLLNDFVELQQENIEELKKYL
ncbi:MAG: hypothetical protein ACI4ON_00175 [Clostridia bacterium]